MVAVVVASETSTTSNSFEAMLLEMRLFCRLRVMKSASVGQ